MARMTQISDDTAHPETASLFDMIRKKLGMVPNLYRVAANQPKALAGMLNLNEALTGGNFDAHTREAIALAVAGVNQCDYCASAHGAISMGMKVPAEMVDMHLMGKSDDPRTMAILKLAVAIVETRGMLSDETLTEARMSGLTESDIVETVANVVANIFTNYLNHVAGTDIDFPMRSAKAA